MMNPFQHNNPGQQRQLELLASSRIQQNALNAQPQQDLFIDRRPSPMPPQQQQQQPQQIQNPIPAKITAQQIPQLQQKYAEITTLIGNLEMQANNLSQSRAGQSDAVYAQRMRAIQEDLNRKRDFAAKLVQILATLGARVPNNAVSTAPTQPSGSSLLPPQQQQQQQQQQQPWMNQPGSQQPPQFMPNQQPSPAPPPFLQPNSRPPQQQQPHPPFPNNMPSNNGQFPWSMQNNQPPTAGNVSQGGPPANVVAQQLMHRLAQMPGPLEKSRFDNNYKEFMRNRPNLRIDPNQMVVDNRSVDIYALHCAVFNEGGPKKVIVLLV